MKLFTKFKNILERIQNHLKIPNCEGGYESAADNRPFPSCLPPLQSESKCKVFVMIISSTLHMNES